MDKKVVLAVAGSGKTRLIIQNLSLEKRALIITYTKMCYTNLKTEVIKKFGYIPENIKIKTYFNFLYQFCYKPYLSKETKAVGINWNRPPLSTIWLTRNNPNFYITNSNYLYSNRIAKLLKMKNCFNLISSRLERFYDDIYIDEIQDFYSYDFDFLNCIFSANVNQTLVGDFFQHTYKTSVDGNYDSRLYSDFEYYKIKMSEIGYVVDQETLIKSYRCTKSVCDFISEKLKIPIKSNHNTISEIKYISDQVEADKYIYDDNIVKLFYQNSSKYKCKSLNWGESKGLDDFNDVVVVLNKTTDNLYRKNNLNKLAETSLNKLYVACTRSKRNVFFIPEALCEKYKK